MVTLELAQVEIDHCLDCGGVWLDRGELEILSGEVPGAGDILLSFSPAENVKEEKRQCPICDRPMGKVALGPEKNIIVDKCDADDGIWFDSGELKKVIETVSAGHNNPALAVIKEMFSEPGTKA
jgi:Zn-finger nucleic acid-binding protein